MIRSLFPAALVTAAIALAVSASLVYGQDTAPAAGNTKAPEVQRLSAVLHSDAATYDKARACQQLAALGDKESVPALAALLGDEKLASHARSGLEVIADPAAGDALRDALGRVHGKLLAGVVNSLGVRCDVQAVGVLRKLAADPAAGVTEEALTALARIATPEAVDTLQQGLAATGADVRAAAAHACLTCAERLLAQGKRPEAIALLGQVRKSDMPKQILAAATYAEILARRSADVSLLAAQLKADDGALFVAAIEASRRIPGPEVTRLLVAELEHLPPRRQAQVIAALADRHDASVLAVVEKAAASGPREARLAAFAAMGQLDDDSTTPLLLDAALASDAALATAARESLSQGRAGGLDAALVARLGRAGPKDRVVLLDILGQRGATRAAAAVVAAVDDRDTDVRVAAVRALGRLIGPEDLPVLIRRLRTATAPEETAVVHDALRTACNRSADRDACARKLHEHMSQASLAQQCFFVELIGAVGGDEALKIVSAYGRDQRPEMQDTATRVLGGWMSPDAAPTLLDLAKTLEDVRYQSRALRGYLRIARQLDLPMDRRLAMCEEALQAAQRDADKQLVADTVRFLIGKWADKAQAARGRAIIASVPHKSVSLFDGRSFDGWEGDTETTFRIESGAIVGGGLRAPVPHNAFLCTRASYANFILRAECRLLGPANGGIQVRSQRVPGHYEVRGYQADMSVKADGGWWGCLYDESRRNRTLAAPDRKILQGALKPNDWNLYEIRCEGPRIRLFLNAVQMVDYTEQDSQIVQRGIIGLQIHGGGPSEAWYRNITIEELP